MKKIFFFLLISCSVWAQGSLPRSTPEAEGIPSSAIIKFLEAAEKSNVEFHSMMIVRHGKVVAEGWWNPYRPDLRHTMYSCSKSFTATAVGLAVSEGKLKVTDKVISFFPDKLPEKISDNLAALEVKDLLSMSVGMEKEPGHIMGGNDWIKSFLAWPIENKPGTKFLYNSAATYMLSAIIQKVTGQKIIDYLTPRLFEPLGIKNIDWEVDPNDINVGGWGLRLKTEDMAKFGQLFLQKGKWNGKQVLPEAWVNEASTMKIMQKPDASADELAKSDWLQGYCYQMWRCRNNGYRGDGANGQFIIMLPEKDAVVIFTAETTDMQSEINLMWENILPAMGPKPLKPNQEELTRLNDKLKALKLGAPDKINSSKMEKYLSGKEVIFKGEVAKKVISASFSFDSQSCLLKLRTDSTDHLISFGREQWNYQKTTKFGPYLVARAMANRKGLPAFDVTGSFTWVDENTLEFTLRYIESPHTETVICKFDGDAVKMDVINIWNQKQDRVPLEGVLR